MTDKNAQKNKLYVKMLGGGGLFGVFVGALCLLVHLVCLAVSAELVQHLYFPRSLNLVAGSQSLDQVTWTIILPTSNSDFESTS